MTGPTAFLRRTPMRRLLEQQGATWRNLPDAAVAETIPGIVPKSGLTLTDLSPLPRLGFKGRGTVPAMLKRGITLEAKANQAYRQADGSLCLVLAPSEVILLSNLKGDGQWLKQLEQSWRLEDEERTYPLLRRDSHAWFLVTGPQAPAMFAKISGIDFRLHKFPDFTIAQTSVAKMTAIVTRADVGKYPAFHLLADSASALYFWSCLTDAAREFGGSILGLGQAEEFETHEAADGGTQL
jgi:sarcosine oxidase subunit gamma